MQNNQLDYHYRVIPHHNRRTQPKSEMDIQKISTIWLIVIGSVLYRYRKSCVMQCTPHKKFKDWYFMRKEQKYLLRCQAWMIVCESLTIESYMNILPHIKMRYRTQECQLWYFNHKMWPNAKHEDELVVSATYANFLFMIYATWNMTTRLS